MAAQQRPQPTRTPAASSSGPAGRYADRRHGYAASRRRGITTPITVGGIGQGDEGEHDVWRGMSQAALDTIRITRATRTRRGGASRRTPRAPTRRRRALTRFHRVFTFDGKAAFTVDGRYSDQRAESVEWFLHADAPFTAQGNEFVLDRCAGPAAGAHRGAGRVEDVRCVRTNLMAPGKPGSITEGKQEQRVTRFAVDVPAATQRGDQGGN